MVWAARKIAIWRQGSSGPGLFWACTPIAYIIRDVMMPQPWFADAKKRMRPLCSSVVYQLVMS